MTAQLKFLDPDEDRPVTAAKPKVMVDMATIEGKEKVAIEIITPDVAEIWLKQYNIDNFRAKMPKTVEKYRAAIKRQRFTLSSSMVIFCTDPDTGKVFLADGQHRLEACVKSGLPIRQVVLRGADPNIILHLDRGKNRKFGDYLARMGFGHCNDLSMALRIFHTYKTNLDRIARPEAEDDDLYELVRRRPDVDLAVQWAAKHSKGRGKPIRMTTSWLAVARALILEVAGLPDCEDPDQARTDADFFFARLVDHDMAELPGPNHPIKQFIQVMYDHGNRSTDRYENYKMMALLIKAWNQYRTAKHSNQLRINLGGKNPESFPEPA
jgi:hypothetical protein